MVMMVLKSIGVNQRAGGTRHDKHRVNQRCASGDGNAMEGPTEALHVFAILFLLDIFQWTLRRDRAFVQEPSFAVYLRMLTDATVLTSQG